MHIKLDKLSMEIEEHFNAIYEIYTELAMEVRDNDYYDIEDYFNIYATGYMEPLLCCHQFLESVDRCIDYSREDDESYERRKISHDLRVLTKLYNSILEKNDTLPSDYTMADFPVYSLHSQIYPNYENRQE